MQGLAKRGFPDKAVGLCREAVTFYPTEVVIWEAISDLQLERKHRVEALNALLEGRAKKRGRRALRILQLGVDSVCIVVVDVFAEKSLKMFLV